jgi:meso-butanediol dehydrogenase/(S,S)-butanediol dehydrogenase/diacetyl reductase
MVASDRRAGVNVDQRVLLVTGAGSGIGAASAEVAAARGWQVVVCGRRRGPLDAVAARTGAAVRVVDVTEPGAVEELVGSVVGEFDRLDSVVANAGVMAVGSVVDTDPEEWDAVLRTNLTSVYLLARAAIPHLAASRGTFVGVGSIAALRSSTGAAAYSVSKAGLISLVQSIARDFGPHGVRANVVCPGWVRTEMADGEMAEFGGPFGLDVEAAYAAATELVPQGRAAEPAEVAKAVEWLAGEESSYVNGAVLVVDGGTILVDSGTVPFDYALTPRTP